MNFLFTLMSFIIAVNGSDTSNGYFFQKDSICNVNERIHQGCSKEVGSFTGVLECLSQCSLDDPFIGVSVDDQGRCFVHDLCASISPLCTTADSEQEYWSRCENGVWNSAKYSCACVAGTYGNRCDKYHQNCKDLISAGYSEGYYHVFIDPLQQGTDPLKVLCYVNPPSSYSIHMIRNRGQINFNRTWNEYVNGFYVDYYNLWAGLKAWNILSSVGCNTAYFALRFKPNYGYIYRPHKKFVMYKEDQHFMFTYRASGEKSEGSIPGSYKYESCMYKLQNTSFSTWDMDNDKDTDKNCASAAGAGWWYSGCDGECNMLGWGLDDLDGTPASQRLKIRGTNMTTAAQYVDYTYAYLKC